MLKSYVTTSARNIVRNKLFSTINILGLGVSMSVGLLMIAMLSDLFSYDKFHDKRDRIFRVVSVYQDQTITTPEPLATTSMKAARAIQHSITGVEEVAMLRREFVGDLEANNKFIPLRGFYANNALFKVFSFELLRGNPMSALTEPYKIVLTESAAKKLFGHIDVLGQTVRKGDDIYEVSGVLEDVPRFSHVKFEVLASFSTFESQQKDNVEYLKWHNAWDMWTYVLVPPSADITSLQASLNKLSEQEGKASENVKISLRLQSINDIVTGENLSNQIGTVIGSTPVRIFLALTFVVIVSACFNYTNLSLARAFKRAKEIGIRKTIGAGKFQVIMQFVVESIVIALLALILSVLIFQLVRPHFINMEQSLQEQLVLDLTPKLIMFFVGFAVTTGILAGLAPAFAFARIGALQAFKNIGSSRLIQGISFRRMLIVFQYCISIMGITATTLIYKQYKHFIHYDLGYSTANILNIGLQESGNQVKAERLKKELLQLPEVKQISQSALVSSLGGYWVNSMKYSKNPEDSAIVYYNAIDESYLTLHDYTLIAGRNFNFKAADTLDTEVIVNEAVLRRFNIAGGDPHKAIGEVVTVNRKDLTIVGVLKDFVYGKPTDHVNKEVIMRYSKQPNYLNVKIESENWPATYARIESIWKKVDPVHSFWARFYNEQIEDSYQGVKASAKVGGFLSALVICIASIGLLGMVVYTTEIRIKEVSIRKVLGASEAGLLVLLGQSFLLLLFIAAGIALPLTYIFFKQVLLPEMGDTAPVTFFDMAGGAAAVLFLALCMIATQTRKVARTNPADVLKSE